MERKAITGAGKNKGETIPVIMSEYKTSPHEMWYDSGKQNIKK